MWADDGDTIICECGKKYHASLTESWKVLHDLKSYLDGIDGKIEVYLLKKMIDDFHRLERLRSKEEKQKGGDT